MIDGGRCVPVAMRRPALLLCLLLLAPVSGAWQLPEIPESEGEWVVVREGGWTHSDWVELREDGLEPLRQLSDTEVLVWGSHGYRIAMKTNPGRCLPGPLVYFSIPAKWKKNAYSFAVCS